jgi:hypothetical protein
MQTIACTVVKAKMLTLISGKILMVTRATMFCGAGLIMAVKTAP